MMSTPVDAVRKNFREIVRRRTGMISPSTSVESGMLETTLIRNGSYCGRRFSLHGYSLIWFIDEQQIKLYSQDGSLLETKSVQDFCSSPLGVPAIIPATETGVEYPVRRAA
ncbi:MAG: hypothetical protein FJ308_01155 [Planctomycetes bacterium]|nr:hypothetical protein [Planctomycetota bacterium]